MSGLLSWVVWIWNCEHPWSLTFSSENWNSVLGWVYGYAVIQMVQADYNLENWFAAGSWWKLGGRTSPHFSVPFFRTTVADLTDIEVWHSSSGLCPTFISVATFVSDATGKKIKICIHIQSITPTFSFSYQTNISHLSLEGGKHYCAIWLICKFVP